MTNPNAPTVPTHIEARKHAVELEQCSIFVDSDPLKRAMTDAAVFLRAIAARDAQAADPAGLREEIKALAADLAITSRGDQYVVDLILDLVTPALAAAEAKGRAEGIKAAAEKASDVLLSEGQEMLAKYVADKLRALFPAPEPRKADGASLGRRAPKRPELDALIADASKAFNALPADEQEAMLRQQRDGYVRAALRAHSTGEREAAGS